MSNSNEFEADRRHARELLADDDLTALHLGVIHEDDTVDTVVSRTPGDNAENLQALSLLATHIRAVATEAGVDPDAVAADAAAIAGQLEELSVGAMSEAADGEGAGDNGTGDSEDAGDDGTGDSDATTDTTDDSEGTAADTTSDSNGPDGSDTGND